MNDKQIVDDIIHYLKSNVAGHIDRDNVFNVLINYVEGEKAGADKIEELEYEIGDLKEGVKNIISSLQDLV